MENSKILYRSSDCDFFRRLWLFDWMGHKLESFAEWGGCATHHITLNYMKKKLTKQRVNTTCHFSRKLFKRLLQVADGEGGHIYRIRYWYFYSYINASFILINEVRVFSFIKSYSKKTLQLFFERPVYWTTCL